ncbi:MAG TPA: hypothetical protein VME43_33495 [Bryobacteraceae bacterium]|nr:hypothetical protein [Bryobacteraceae bacterium]
MTEAQITPPEPPRDGSDTKAELRFDTVDYGVGNWHLYHGEKAKAQEYFRRLLQGKVWVTLALHRRRTRKWPPPPAGADDRTPAL